MKFRNLKKEEIQVRIMRSNSINTRLLLYTEARTVANILDETVGAENWKRDIKEFKSGIASGIGIYNKDLKEFIFKWDVGESQDHSLKGDSSDALKRCAVLWGIGNELYSTPEIQVKNEYINWYDLNGKKNTNDTFILKDYEVKDDIITKLFIANQDGKIIFNWSK